jgi:phosphohistidine phosphatase
MKLTLVRHGLAVEREDFAKLKKDDALRPLLPKGREKILQMAEHLLPWTEGVDLIVTSPYVRAKQSALILQKVLKPKKFIEAVELIPSAPPMAFAEWLRRNAALMTSVVAVGHEPQLDSFASWALAGAIDSFIKIKKSGALGLEVEGFHQISPQSVELRFLVHPGLFED